MKQRKAECPGKLKYLAGKRILPEPISRKTDIVTLIDNMDAYNGGRLRAACHLLRDKYSQNDVTVGLSLAGALTPAGLGPSAVIPLMNHGFVDWITATGANMYHDLHFAFNLPMHRGSHLVDDVDLRDKGVTRIYDILFDYEDVLMETDRRLRKIMLQPEFQKEMGTREFYYHMGKVMNEYEEKNKLGEVSIVAAAYRNGIPVFTSSPGDSTIGMNIAGLELLAETAGLQDAFRLRINPSIDVNDSTAIILNAKRFEHGSPHDPRGGTGLRHQYHRRQAGYGRIVGGPAQRGGKLGQDRPDEAGRSRHRLSRRHGSLAADGRLCPAYDQGQKTKKALPPGGGAARKTGRVLPGKQQRG
jgi:deoxyhypusine synthase